jgi:uncharacterized protein YndB with AHSA1/START domain
MAEPMRITARVPAPVATVHRALTEADALRTWLAEHAEVDLPERYAFWGRYTPDGDAPHQRPLEVDEHTVRFAWLIGDEETIVEFTLAAEDGGATLVTVSQSGLPSWSDIMAGKGGIRGALHTFWSLAVANLIDYVDGRPLTPKCDFTTAEMRAEVLIGAEPQKVYESMTDPAQFRRWFGANVDIELFVGGRFAMGGFDLDPSPAKIVELEPGHKMVMAWDGMVSAWELEGTGGKTRLTFLQSGFDPANPPYDAWMGWLSGVAELRRYHELDSWKSVWQRVEWESIPEGMLALE